MQLLNLNWDSMEYELGQHDCAPGVTASTQNPLGARHQAAARWRNEEGRGVGGCKLWEMLWV